MIAKVIGGSSFSATLNYLMNEKEQEEDKRKNTEKEREASEQKEERISGSRGDEKAPIGRLENDALSFFDESEGERYRVIGGNMSGRTQRELAREFDVFREQRPDVKKPVHHASLSTAPGENWGVKLWNEIAEKYVTSMGFENSPFIVIQHTDTAHNHIHILTSRIDANGKVVSDFQSKQRAEEVMREVEREYGLEQVRSSRDVMRRAPTRGEMEWFYRTGELSTKMRLQDAIDRALQDAPSTAEFITRLDKVGVRVNPNVQDGERVSGITFERAGEVMKGSDLGRGYSWQGLQKRGLGYEPERDLPQLKEAKVNYLEAQLERKIEARKLPEQLVVTESEIAELRVWLTDRYVPAQGRDIQREMYVPEQPIDAPAEPITADSYQPPPGLNPLAEPFSNTGLNFAQMLNAEQIGHEAWQQQNPNNFDSLFNGQDSFVRATDYDSMRSAEELLRDATQIVYDRKATAEQVNLIDPNCELVESSSVQCVADGERQQSGAHNELDNGSPSELTQTQELDVIEEIEELEDEWEILLL